MSSLPVSSEEAVNGGSKTDVPPTQVSEYMDYDDYAALHKDQPAADSTIELTNAQITSRQNAIFFDKKNDKASVVELQETGWVEWTVDAVKEGMYVMNLAYMPLPGKGADIECSLTINGEIPFFEAQYFTFSRLWTDDGKIIPDSRGNDRRPETVEAPCWETTALSDYLGYHQQPFTFYLREGQNTLRLYCSRETVAIADVKLAPASSVPTYEQYLASHAGAVSGRDEIQLRAELPSLKSTTTVFAVNDRSSSRTTPQDYYAQKLNAIGGSSWNQHGQWLEYSFTVETAGFYTIHLRTKQNFAKGTQSYRTIYLDGEIPFAEMAQVPFEYQANWYYKTLGGSTPYQFYLEPGPHTLRIEATLGSYTDMVRQAQLSVKNLNAAYRKALMLMGPSPDQYRDYNIAKTLPDVIQTFEQEVETLENLLTSLQENGNTKSDRSAILDRFAYQLRDFVENPESLSRRMDALKSNIGALGTWASQMSEQPLRLDEIVIAGTSYQPEAAEDGFWGRLVHGFKNFFASFVVDYSSIGSSTGEGEPLTVWLPSGRDQANVLNRIMSDSLPAGLNVNLRLVSGGVLLPSVVAGRGPDVILQVGSGEPLNFAIRGGVYDLTQFPDSEEVFKRFTPSSLLPVQFNGAVYALPETESFPVLFYRKDILQELELEVPDTWDELVSIISVLQQNNMTFGFGSGMDSFAILLYQYGGSFYQNEGESSGLAEENALQAFSFFTELFSDYKLPLTIDFKNRFRTGEMPIGIADYTTFNTLAVFAPEINGLWDMALIPGTQTENGIDRSVASTSTDCMIISTTDQPQESWEFLKWWTSASTQSAYGQGVESVFGPAGRYSPANIEAFQAIPWSSEQLKTINAQKEWARGIPNVPGGYFTSRHFTNAFRKVVYSQTDYRETMLEYVATINKELQNKRIEFGLEEKK